MKWVETTFGEFVDCNPMIKCKRNCLVENCEMEDIDANFKYLYPQQGKFYTGSGSKFQNGDTVFSRITPCLENGKIAQIKGLKGNVGVGSTEFFVFRGKANVSDNDFVYYLANSRYIRKSAENSMAGASGRQRADLKFIKSRTIRVPEKVEDQKKIATILSHYDDLIEINKRRIALLEKSARELYKEWFVRMRFPGWETSEFVNGVPNDWDEKEFSSIIDICSSKRIFQSEYVSNGVPFYRGQEITQLANNELIDNVLYISKERYDQIRKSNDVPQEGDILLTAVGTIGNSFMVDNREFYFKDGNIIWLKTRNSNLKYYLYSLLNTSYFRELINNTCIGSSQKALTIDMVGKIKIVVPSESVIKKFSQLYEVFHSAKNILIKEIYKLSLQRDRLLPRLMSGQLEV